MSEHNGTAETPVETILFNAGLLSADDLGELVRDAVVAQRPIAALAIERNVVTPQALQALIEQSRDGAAAEAPAPPVGGYAEGPPLAPAPPVSVLAPAAPPFEPVPVAPVPFEQVSFEPVAVQPAAYEPAPVASLPPLDAVAPAPPVVALAAVPDEPTVPEAPAVAETPAVAAFEVVLRLAGGERVQVGPAATYAEAEELTRSTAARLASSAEWPFLAGRCIRPDGVVSVDIVRSLGA